MSTEARRLRASLQAKAEDYEQVVNENADLRRENARLQGQIEALREHVPAEIDKPPDPYPSPRVRAALAEAYDRSAPPMGWPYPERVTQA